MAKRPPNALWSILERARELTDSVIVPVSTGKDSLAVLETCQRYFKRIELFHWYVVRGLSFRESALARVEKRYGLKVRQIPHFMLSRLLRHGVHRVPSKATLTAPRSHLKELETDMREQTGIDWIAYGQKRCDSLERTAMLSACDNIDHKARRIYPLAWWNNGFVFRFLKQQRIPLPSDYAEFPRGNFDGGDLRGRVLVKLRDRWPEDYQRVLAVFPFAEGEVRRYERFGDDKRHIPAVTPSRFRCGLVEIPKEQERLGASPADEIPSEQSPSD